MKNWLLKKLGTEHYRLTPTRLKICQEIEKLHGIFCAQQIIKKTKIRKASIYRALEVLEKLKLIRPAINLRGEQFYEKNDHQNHHHHLICTNCKKSVCVNTHEPKIKDHKFKNINHLLIFTGICSSCAK